MINVTVVNKKTIVKYLVWVAILGIGITCTRFFNTQETKEAESKIIEQIKNYDFLSCIEDTLPNIDTSNESENKQMASSRNSALRKVLNVELPMIDTLIEEGEEDIVENKPQEVAKEENVQTAPTGVTTQEITENNITGKYTTTFGTVKIKNESNKEITEDMLNSNLELENKKDIVIFHTHTCESYTPSDSNYYDMTGSYRTTDLNFTVARVGTELEKQLNKEGYQVTHDQTYHDYPAYTGSYGRSLTTVENILKQNSSQIVIDLHRDAVGSNANYAPSVKIGEEVVAQMMFVIGTDGGGLWHNNWGHNLKFAIKMQEKANELYPGLFRPIIVRNSRYNQHLAKAATIIEVGATGNTLEQCLGSMKYLAKVITEVVK